MLKVSKGNIYVSAAGIVLAFLFNTINFPSVYFYDFTHFIVLTLIFFVQYFILFRLFKEISNLFKILFTKEKHTYLRLSLIIFIFILVTGLSLFGTFKLYASFSWFLYEYNENVFLWNYFAFTIFNIFITFLLEGINSFRDWKQNTNYNENLSSSYSRSRIDALKSQVNPHFLFNSLNSLSSLIQEDQDKAEKFLDEMSKIYRYMLRNDEEIYVKLETELSFIKSYHHLLHARFGDGLQISIKVDEIAASKFIAPLSLQVIIENAFTQNIVSKSQPLKIAIYNKGEHILVVKNNIQPKAVTGALDFEAGLDNLIKKYKLLGLDIKISDSQNLERIIELTLNDKLL